MDHVASGGEADAALLTNNGLTLLILDLGLPKMHGLEVLKEAAWPGKPALPVLILTAADSVEERVKGWTMARTTTWPAVQPAGLEARVQALTRRGMGRGEQRHQARAAGVRPGRARGDH